jgi:hypothetical protein
MVNKALHRKLKIEQHEPSKNRGWITLHSLLDKGTRTS